jgi:hypothetical protein
MGDKMAGEMPDVLIHGDTVRSSTMRHDELVSATSSRSSPAVAVAGAMCTRVHAEAFLHAICGVCLPGAESPRPAALRPAAGHFYIR